MTSASSSSSSSALSSILLWLPYLIFTVVLLGLIVVSFLRFHCQRGHQYRRRQAELNDKLQTTAGNHHDTLHLLPTSGEAGGAPLRQPNGTAPPSGVPQHMNLFVQYSQLHPGPGDEPEVGGRRRGEASTSGGNNSESKTSSVHRTGNASKKQPQGGAGDVTARRPLVFTFNVNGSMVDIRCDEEERTNTFRLKPNADSAAHDGCKEEIDLGNGGQSIVQQRHYCKNRYNRRHVTANHGRGVAALVATGNSCAAHAQRTLPGGRTTLEKLRDSSEDEALLLGGERRHL